MSDIPYIDHAAVGGADRQIVQLLDLLGTGVDPDVVLELPDFLRACRQDQVLRGNGCRDIGGGEPLGAQRPLIEIHLHLSLPAAVGVGNRRTRNCRQLSSDDVVAQIEDDRFGQRVAGQGELYDRHGRSVIRENERRIRSGRQAFQCALRYSRDLRIRQHRVGIGLKEVLHHRGTVERLRLGVFDVVDGRLRSSLGGQHDAIRHVARLQTGVAPDRRDDRDPDGGKDVDGGPPDREQAHQENEDRQYNEGVRSL